MPKTVQWKRLAVDDSGWEDAYRPGDTPTPYADPDWWRYGSPEHTELLRCNDHDGATVCALPALRLRWGALGLGGYVFSECYSLALKGSVPDQDCLEALFTRLCKSRICWLRMEWPGIDDDFVQVLLNAGRARGWTVMTEDARQSPTIDFPPPQERPAFEDYFKQLNKKKFRDYRSLNRKVDKYDGNFEFEFRSGPFSKEWIPELMDVESRSHKRGMGLFSAPNGELLADVYEGREVLLGILRLDGKAVAWELDDIYGDRAHAFNRYFDDSFRPLALGKHLSTAMIRRAYEMGLSGIDLMGDVDRLKKIFANGVIPRYRAELFSSSLCGRWRKWAFTTRRKWKEKRNKQG